MQDMEILILDEINSDFLTLAVAFTLLLCTDIMHYGQLT